MDLGWNFSSFLRLLLFQLLDGLWWYNPNLTNSDQNNQIDFHIIHRVSTPSHGCALLKSTFNFENKKSHWVSKFSSLVWEKMSFSLRFFLHFLTDVEECEFRSAGESENVWCRKWINVYTKIMITTNAKVWSWEVSSRHASIHLFLKEVCQSSIHPRVRRHDSNWLWPHFVVAHHILFSSCRGYCQNNNHWLVGRWCHQRNSRYFSRKWGKSTHPSWVTVSASIWNSI